MKYTTQKAYQDYQDFIEVWQEAVKAGKGHRWVANCMGLTEVQVRYRAQWLRNKGVTLKPMKHGIKKGYKYRKQSGHILTGFLVLLTTLVIAIWVTLLFKMVVGDVK